MTKINKVITVCLLTDSISGSVGAFGASAESSFPDSPNLTVFFENSNVVGYGVNEFKLGSVNDESFIKSIQLLAPFLNADQSFAWLFSCDENNVTDISMPDSVSDLSVGFAWDGDATALESALQEECEDDWESELDTFKELLASSDTVAVGWKYVRDCNWDIKSNSELNTAYGNAEWDVSGEGCFVIVRY